MPATLKVLGQLAPNATTEGDLYTVAAATTAVASSVVICNRNSAAATFRVSVSVGGAATATKDYLYYDVTLGGNDTFVATIGMSLGAADKVRVYGSTANLSYTLFGQEVT